MKTVNDYDHPDWVCFFFDKPCYHRPAVEIAAKITCMFGIMLLGITGNVSIIYIILKNRLLRLQPTNLFLLNMAVTDLLNLCINPILYLFRNDAIVSNYLLGETFCTISPLFTSKFYYSTL